MEVSNITVTVLRRLLTLSEKRESLLTEIGSIDKEIASLTSGKPVKSGRKAKAVAPSTPKGKPGRKPGKTAKRGKRGALKEQILALLADAGEAGARVKDIAVKLGAKPQNIHVWFSSTGKKLANIARMDAGHYKIVSASEPAPATLAGPAKKTRKKRKSSK